MLAPPPLGRRQPTTALAYKSGRNRAQLWEGLACCDRRQPEGRQRNSVFLCRKMQSARLTPESSTESITIRHKTEIGGVIHVESPATVETPVLEPDELERLLAQLNTRTATGARNNALLRLMAHTGLRCGEALQVRASDIRQETWARPDGGKHQVWMLRVRASTTKGGKPRQGLPLDVGVRQAVDLWQEKRSALGIGAGPLFCTISQGVRSTGFARDGGSLTPGEPLNSRYVRSLVKRLGRQAGIIKDVHPHMLRHTALTRLYDETRDLRMVQMVAGHQSARVTERYTHVHPLALAEAMGALRDE